MLRAPYMVGIQRGHPMSISPDAAARREAARDHGRFGEQPQTAPELTLDAPVTAPHGDEMAVRETRLMPLTNDETPWYDDTLELAVVLAAKHNVQGTVTRVTLPDSVSDPAARYVASLTSAFTAVGRPFVYDTGDQYFEQTTPSVAEVLCEAAVQANHEGGRTSASGDQTAMDRLIDVLGERDARELLAKDFLAGQPPQYEHFTIRTDAGRIRTFTTTSHSDVLRELRSWYPNEEFESWVSEPGAGEKVHARPKRPRGVEAEEAAAAGHVLEDTYTVSHPAYRTSTGLTMRSAMALASTMGDYMAKVEDVQIVNERSGRQVPYSVTAGL